MRKFVSFGPAFVVMLTMFVALVAAPAVMRGLVYARTEATITLAQHQLDDDDILERINRATRAVATSVEPSVVHIDVSVPMEAHSISRRTSGSGWVYDSSGHIVTNAHVVRGAEEVRIQFFDGRLDEAHVIGVDPLTDIAVLRVDNAKELFPIRRATGEQPQRGDRVFSFGSPFGFKFSMTEGIVSGLGRSPSTALGFNGYTNFIQTDAAVNPGNSGGPLVDIKGKVIGMNVAIATGRDTQGTAEEGQSAGISFAIPLPAIEPVVEQLIRHGRVTRGFLGVNLPGRAVPVSNEDGFVAMGVPIPGIVEDGPAANAGLMIGDVITRIDGQLVGSVDVLRSVIATTPPGQEVEVSAWRDQTERIFNVVLQEFERADLARQTIVEILERGYGLDFQRELGVRPITGSEEPFLDGVRIQSRAAQAGFTGGMELTHIGSTRVRTVNELCLALEDQGYLLGKRIEVTVASVVDDQVKRSQLYMTIPN